MRWNIPLAQWTPLDWFREVVLWAILLAISIIAVRLWRIEGTNRYPVWTLGEMCACEAETYRKYARMCHDRARSETPWIADDEWSVNLKTWYLGTIKISRGSWIEQERFFEKLAERGMARSRQLEGVIP